ncbi:uncharacterized protein LOC108488652 isoform X1 [Gossypium arboreum]|uniref:uncharacterized protein LOC108488652 isoform X1 n=1 Tax=Gossypium arboreum TaxID=29729 RepID=UPI000818FA41|nr:uncharacterized protein LOC108488652 isoform X1 [Gossypium arboreum]
MGLRRLPLLVCVLIIVSWTKAKSGRQGPLSPNGISFQQLLQVEGWRREPVLCTHDEDCKDYCKGLYRCIKGCCNCFDEMQVQQQQQQQQQHVNEAFSVSSCSRGNGPNNMH